MELLLTLMEIIVVLSIVSILIGIVQLISSKGEKGLKYVIGGIITISVLLIIGFGTCVVALNS